MSIPGKELASTNTSEDANSQNEAQRFHPAGSTPAGNLLYFSFNTVHSMMNQPKEATSNYYLAGMEMISPFSPEDQTHQRPYQGNSGNSIFSPPLLCNSFLISRLGNSS